MWPTHTTGPSLLVAATLAGLALVPPAGASTPASEEVIDVAATQTAIAVNGRLDEPAWSQATVIPLPLERYPAENEPAPVATECLLTYDDRHLYVGFRATDPEPGQIRAHLADRDRARDDDLVGIVLDTFNDERRGYLFLANPQGVQLDAAVIDIGQHDLDLSTSHGGTGVGEDFSWDAIWEAAGRVTASGYSVEMAIPFSSLRFPEGGEAQTWGFDAVRIYPRSDRRRLGVSAVDTDRSCYLCQVAKLHGLSGLSPGRNLEIAPTLTTLRTDRRPAAGDGLESGPVDTEPGLSARWGITTNLSLNATLNPDFSQVEADVAQLDVNTRTALFFPEKRPFFLEGADLFATSINAVHTRTVVDPSWGVKLSGKQGRHALAAFVAEDEVTQLLIPGPQGSRSTQLDFATRDAAARYRRDLGKTSTVGLLATAREGGGYSNHLFGVDGIARLTAADTVRFQALGSRTRYPEAVVREFGQPTGTLEDEAFHVTYRHRSRDWSWEALWEDVGRDFRADLGFLTFVDYRWGAVSLERTFWGAEEDPYTQLRFGGTVEETRDHEGLLLDRINELRGEIRGGWQSRLHLRLREAATRFADRLFDNDHLILLASARPSARLGLSLEARIGDDIDFVNARPADGTHLASVFELAVGKHLDLELRHTFDRLEVEGGELFRANLSESRLIYHLDVRTFVRLIVQHSAVRRDPSLFTSPVEADSDSLFSQLLFSYRLNAQTALLAGYSDRWGGSGETSLTRDERTFFVKLSYAWVL